VKIQFFKLNFVIFFKVFGIEIEEILSREPGNSIPSFINQCISFINQKALDHEGIFRLSGSAIEIQNIKDLLDRGKFVDISEKDPNAVAGLLKLWLRELPDGLLSTELYDDWLEVGSNKFNSIKILILIFFFFRS